MRGLLGVSLGLFLYLSGLQGQTIEESFDRLYNFEFTEAHEILDRLAPTQSERPLFHAARAAVYLFGEMARLEILASQYYLDRGQKLREKKFEPRSDVRAQLYESLRRATELANLRLESAPEDADAHFVLALTAGIESNYAVFVEKRRLAALPLARRSHLSALRALKTDPDYIDAYLITGLNEYVFSNLPFVVRWVARFDQVSGSKELGIERLEFVAQSGRYLSGLAKILLSTIYIREKQYGDAQRVTEQLVADYPQNPVFREELNRLHEKTGKLVRAR